MSMHAEWLMPRQIPRTTSGTPCRKAFKQIQFGGEMGATSDYLHCILLEGLRWPFC